MVDCLINCVFLGVIKPNGRVPVPVTKLLNPVEELGRRSLFASQYQVHSVMSVTYDGQIKLSEHNNDNKKKRGFKRIDEKLTTKRESPFVRNSQSDDCEFGCRFLFRLALRRTVPASKSKTTYVNEAAKRYLFFRGYDTKASTGNVSPRSLFS